ncbi:MAG: hypothetical protein KIT22_19945 [Verrucomicrobiae bacterium]|nr:hypothetical protein [Verrucomicrobiae bacterium]
MSEELHTCPQCGRDKFTVAGLARHRCRPAVEATGAENLPVAAPKIPKLPVSVTGTWDGARRWRDAAVAMERGKLFCQVMLGFELLCLREAHSQPGTRTDLETSGQTGRRLFGEIVEKELGVADRTARRLMEMAEAAKPRLKKLPGLRDFDPTVKPVAELPAPQQQALESAVKKLTDGTTQVEFMRDLGIAKLPQGAAAAGRAKGEGGRKKLSPSEEVEILQSLAREDWRAIEDRLLGTYREKFTLLSDPEVTAQIAALERALEARKAWLKTKPEARDAQEIAARFAA